MKRLLALVLAGAALVCVPFAALAQAAYAAKTVHLRAGPSRDYPVVVVLPAGLSLAVQGCLSDYTWCDVIAGPYRGWVYAANIDYVDNGQGVSVLRFGPELGIAIVGFGLLDYWNHFYADRPFYRDRDRWAHRPPPPLRAPPRPMPLPGRHGPNDSPPHGGPGERGREHPHPPGPPPHTPPPRHENPPGAQPPRAQPGGHDRQRPRPPERGGPSH